MGLFGFIKKSSNTPISNERMDRQSITKPTNKTAYEPNRNLDHLTNEGELPWGWYSKNNDFTDSKKREYDYFLNLWINSREMSPKEQISALSSFVKYMNDLRDLCIKKGECFNFWRKILFEDEYLQQRESELQFLKDNFETIYQQYLEKQRIQTEVLPRLRGDLLSIIKRNPNILQTEIYKMFKSEEKPYVSEELYFMAKDGLIARNKKGRTYELNLI